MDIYLPIAEVSLDIFVLLGLGAAVGFLSGVFGVGGGFLLTPLLIFIGVPPAVAVASSANQLVGASVSGVIAHRRLGARRLPLHPAQADRSGRTGHLACLRDPARHAWRIDVCRERPRPAKP